MKIKLILTCLVIMTNILNGFSNEQNKNILIVYGSFSGSTKEIADSMSIYLTKNSNTVDVLAAEKIRIDLSKYDLIIIGSAIHGDNPHPKIFDFINTNKDGLNKKKIAIFIVCGTITSTKKNKRDNALTYPDKIGKGLNPISKVVFAGNMPSSGKKFDEFLAKHLLGIVTGDFRDWVKIKNWVKDVARM